MPMQPGNMDKRLLIGIDEPYPDREWEWRSMNDWGVIRGCHRFIIKWKNNDVTWTDSGNFVDFRPEAINMIKKKVESDPNRLIGKVEAYYWRVNFDIDIFSLIPSYTITRPLPDAPSDSNGVKGFFTTRQQKFSTPLTQNYWTSDNVHSRLDFNLGLLRREEREKKLRVLALTRTPRIAACTVLDGRRIITTPKVLAKECRKGKLQFEDEDADVKKKGDASKSKKRVAGAK